MQIKLHSASLKIFLVAAIMLQLVAASVIRVRDAGLGEDGLEADLEEPGPALIWLALNAPSRDD
ncbi:hypothetical protein DFH07DRAFT_966758 [Mycena maculata]|uniref:Secreted protein n=1 Tax=Mycena maculata TaxID=230809 RepID=A0AAD7MXP2_9AGAR|nr:hypothetical protein DFH07DRAFT_966758 [Mycena maculata]